MDLSVIICTYNRSATLKRTLDSIMASSIPHDLKWELVIVNNNSKDNTEEVVKSFQDHSRLGFEAAPGRGVTAF